MLIKLASSFLAIDDIDWIIAPMIIRKRTTFESLHNIFASAHLTMILKINVFLNLVQKGQVYSPHIIDIFISIFSSNNLSSIISFLSWNISVWLVLDMWLHTYEGGGELSVSEKLEFEQKIWNYFIVQFSLRKGLNVSSKNKIQKKDEEIKS